MRQFLIAFGILAVLLVAGCATQQAGTETQTPAVGGQGQNQPMIPANSSQGAGQQQASSTGGGVRNQPMIPAPGSASKTAKVTIQNFAYSPADITVQKGTTVTWTNLDSVQHTVTSDTGLFDSGRLSQDQTWSYTFNNAGTFSYHCTIHPYMKGTVTVQ